MIRTSIKYLLAACAALLFIFTAAGPHEAAIPYFRYVRKIKISAPRQQNYIVVDQDLWEHSRADLSDVRLYDGGSQVPYALRKQSGGVLSLEQEARILNLGTVVGKTEFDIDAGALEEYDRIRLRLSARNFVATAKISGKHSANEAHAVHIGQSTLYDFTRENLGSNFVLQIPPSSFPFLHVQLSSGIKPEQVKSAAISDLSEKRAQWVPAGVCRVGSAPALGQFEVPQRHASWYRCAFSSAVPIDRLMFQVGEAQINFRRDVRVFSEGAPAPGENTGGNKQPDFGLVLTGEISRIKTRREGKNIVSENLALSLPEARAKELAIEIGNGDDAPLSLTVLPFSMARRIYFDPAGRASIRLYSGDEKLGPPTYDYAKFFHEDASAVEAHLGPASENPAFTGRPDERPWSEQHKGILWIAMLAAVAVLALLAIRGFASEVKGKA